MALNGYSGFNFEPGLKKQCQFAKQLQVTPSIAKAARVQLEVSQ